jgi:hypothetical protein
MIEILGVTFTVEMLIALGVAFAVDELLPFLPTKYNGIAHAVILGLKKAKIGQRVNVDLTTKVDRALELLEKWDSEITKNERVR